MPFGSSALSDTRDELALSLRLKIWFDKEDFVSIKTPARKLVMHNRSLGYIECMRFRLR